MRKLISTVFLLISIIGAFFIGSVFAQDMDIDPGNVPVVGANCGIPDGKNGTNQCCSNKNKNVLWQIPGTSLFEHIWVVGDLFKRYEDLRQEVSRVNEKYSLPCVIGEPDKDPSDPSCTCQLTDEAKPIPKLEQLCDEYIINTGNPNQPAENERVQKEHDQCVSCAKKGGYWSGLSCVPLSVSSFITDTLLGIGIGVGGFIALLCIFYSVIILQTSQGDAEKITKARENLTSCVIGLLLIIFSVFILRLIGVDILSLPGFL